MSMPRQIEIKCGGCGAVQRFTTWQSLNVSLNPEEKEKLLKTTLNRFTCEKCQWAAQIEYSILYHDMRKNLMIWCIPRDAKVPKMPVGGRLNEYQLRVVRSWNDLHEKIIIFDHLLDDRLIEIHRVQTLQGMPEHYELRFAGRGQDAQDKELLTFVLLAEGLPLTMEVPEEQLRTMAESLRAPLSPFESIAGKWLRVEGSKMEEVTTNGQEKPGKEDAETSPMGTAPPKKEIEASSMGTAPAMEERKASATLPKYKLYATRVFLYAFLLSAIVFLWGVIAKRGDIIGYSMIVFGPLLCWVLRASKKSATRDGKRNAVKRLHPF
jgi:hypothetical protein